MWTKDGHGRGDGEEIYSRERPQWSGVVVRKRQLWLVVFLRQKHQQTRSWPHVQRPGTSRSICDSCPNLSPFGPPNPLLTQCLTHHTCRPPPRAPHSSYICLSNVILYSGLLLCKTFSPIFCYVRHPKKYLSVIHRLITGILVDPHSG